MYCEVCRFKCVSNISYSHTGSYINSTSAMNCTYRRKSVTAFAISKVRLTDMRKFGKGGLVQWSGLMIANTDEKVAVEVGWPDLAFVDVVHRACTIGFC